MVQTNTRTLFNFKTMDSPLLRFIAVMGYFLQDDPATDPDTFDYVRDPNILVQTIKQLSDDLQRWNQTSDSSKNTTMSTSE